MTSNADPDPLIYKKVRMIFTFLDRIPQKPPLLMFHFEPSITSKERFPEKIPTEYNKDIDSQVKH